MEYVRAARLVGAQARVYTAEISPLLYELGEALFDVALISARLLLALSRPLSALIGVLRRALAPTLFAASSAAWGLFIAQSPEALALEASLGLLLLLLIGLEARFGVLRSVWSIYCRLVGGMARWYRGVKNGVREKSRTAAAALSHGVFVGPCLILSAWFGPAFQNFARTWGLILASCVRPVWQTIGLLYEMEYGNDFEDEVVHPSRRTPSATPGRHRASEEPDSMTIEDVSDAGSEDADEGRSIEGTEHLEDEPLRPDEVSASVSSANSAVNPKTRGALRRRRQSANAISTPAAAQPMRTSVDNVEQLKTPPARNQSAKLRALAVQTAEMETLRFWSVFGALWAARALALYFVPSLFNGLLLRLDSFLFFFLLWLQIGLTRGADILFPLIASSLRQGHYLRSNASAGAEQLNVFLRVLVSVGAVPAERAAMITSNLTESGVVLVGVIFFITPRSATYVGTLLTGYLVPVYFTVFAATPASPPVTRQTWLSYWAVFAVIETFHMQLSKTLDWVPLWYHGKLALILWLQVPYYRGASVLLESGMGYFGSFVSTCRQTTVTPRKLRVD